MKKELWKKSKKNNVTIAHVSYAKNEKIYPAYVSKQSSKHEKTIILNREEWHYLAEKKPALLRGLISKHDSDFYSVNCLHSCRTKKNLNCIKYVEIKIFVML